MVNNIFQRFFKVLFRILVILVIFSLIFLIGAIIGYSFVGGGNPLDIFTPSFWQTLIAFF